MFIDEPVLAKCLNLAIFALNPLEKWPAHITIAGPFPEKSAVPRSLEFAEQISVIGRGRFLNGRRHTVFLHAGSLGIHSRMHKPDYPGAIPHLSLYSGNDAELADLLYSRLEQVNVFGVFYNRKLAIVESNEQYNFNFRSQIDTSISRLTTGLSLDQIRKMSKEDRVGIAVNVVEYGFAYSARRSAFKAGRLIKQ